MAKIEQKILKEYLHYEPTTGVFTWIKKYHKTIVVGKRAGTITNGYYFLSVNKKRIKANRAAWIYMNGDIPDGMIIDHINHNPSDDRIENLRCVTPCQSSYNTRKRSHNKSGYKGVRKKRDKWCASITHNKKVICLGSFFTKEDAYKAYCEAATKYHGEFACVE